MKIAIFCPYNILRPGGVQDIVHNQVLELQKRKHSVTVITPRPRDHSGPPPEGVVFIGVSTAVKAQDSTPDVSAVIDQGEIDTFFATHKFDVVHFHEPVVPFVGRQLIAACPYPVVATLHAALPETVTGKTLGAIKPYFRSVLQHVDVLTRVSSAAGGYLSEILSKTDVLEVPNGVPLAQYSPSRSRRSDTIVYVGRLEKRKGPKYLIKAFAELVQYHPDMKLIMVGDGHDREKLEEQVAELGIHSNVEFRGFVDEKVKFDLLKSATFACYPALYGESFGIVLLEALATGTPIIAGDNPGYATVLRGKGLMCLVNPKNTDEFVRRMRLYIEDPETRSMLTQWGLMHVKQYDFPVIIAQYLEIYKSLVEK